MQQYKIDWDENKQEAILHIYDDSGWSWEGGTVAVFIFLYRAYRTAEFENLKKQLIDDHEKRAILQIIMSSMANNTEARYLLADAMIGGNSTWESDIDDFTFLTINRELEELFLNDYVMNLAETGIDRKFLWNNEFEILEILRNSYPVKNLSDEDRSTLIDKFCCGTFKNINFTDPLLFFKNLPDQEDIAEKVKELLQHKECTLNIGQYNKWIERASNEIKILMKTKGGEQVELHTPEDLGRTHDQGFN